MAGANNNRTMLFGVIEFIPPRESMAGLNCRVARRTINQGRWSGGDSLLYLFNVLKLKKNSTSPNTPTNAEAGPDCTNAIIYSFRPRCLPVQEYGSACEAAFHQGERLYGNH